MRIFLSHSSIQKPLVREIKKRLPQHLNAWIDEERLLFGESTYGSPPRAWGRLLAMTRS